MIFSLHRRSLPASIAAAALLLCSASGAAAQDAQSAGHDRIEQALNSVNRGHALGLDFLLRRHIFRQLQQDHLGLARLFADFDQGEV